MIARSYRKRSGRGLRLQLGSYSASEVFLLDNFLSFLRVLCVLRGESFSGARQ